MMKNLIFGLCAAVLSLSLTAEEAGSGKGGGGESSSPVEINVDGGQGTVTHEGVLDVSADTVITVGNGSIYLVPTITGSAALTKRGSGTLRFFNQNEDSSRKEGVTRIEEGTVEFGDKHRSFQLGNAVYIGGGEASARVVCTYTGSYNVDLFTSNTRFVVHKNGELDFSANVNSKNTQSLNAFRIEKGGVLRFGNRNFVLNGTDEEHLYIEGRIEGTTKARWSTGSGRIVIPETMDAPVVWAGGYSSQRKYASGETVDGEKYSGHVYPRLDIADAPGIPVELEIQGTLGFSGWPFDGKTGFHKRGAGVLRLIGNSVDFGGDVSDGGGSTRIYAGTLLADNSSGSATGKSFVDIKESATLGGVGTLGGLEGAVNADVRAVGSDTARAVVRPGSIDSVTGAHVFGTLTVGSETQANSVAFGAHSELRIGVGSKAVDALKVHGAVTIDSSAILTIALENGCTKENAKAGKWTILSATEGITGDFASVEKPAKAWSVRKVMSTRTLEDGSEEEFVGALELVVLKGLSVFVR